MDNELDQLIAKHNKRQLLPLEKDRFIIKLLEAYKAMKVLIDQLERQREEILENR